MIIHVGKHEFTEVWDGVLYKKFAHYPKVSDWEIRTLIEFSDYEERHGRQWELRCEDEMLRQEILRKMEAREQYATIPRPALLTECTSCPVRKGCVTKYVCHTASPENAALILASGKLLSACQARGLSGEELMREPRNAAKDPADYFSYVMLAWGNCQAGDRLVMERKLGRFPDEGDLSIRFTPGVRFYFLYDELAKHPKCEFDGVLPMKIKDEIDLQKWVHLIVIPEVLRSGLNQCIPEGLQERVVYVENDCQDIWEWSEKVYQIVEERM